LYYIHFLLDNNNLL